MRDFRKPAWHHHWDACRETSTAQMVTTLRLGGITEFVPKTHEAQTWQSTYDRDPLAYNSLAKIKEHFDAFEAAGIDFWPFCNPRLDNWGAEAKFSLEVAKVCKMRLEVDVEWWQGFQDTPQRRRDFWPFCRYLVDNGVNLRADVDARRVNLDPFDADAPGFLKWLFGKASEVWIQNYWTDFGKDAIASTDYGNRIIQAYDIPLSKIGHILPYQDPGNFARVVAHLDTLGQDKVGFWVTGSAGLAVYTAMAKIPGKRISVPSPSVLTPEFVALFTSKVETNDKLLAGLIDEVTVGLAAMDALSVADSQAFVALSPALDLMRTLVTRGREAVAAIYQAGVAEPRAQTLISREFVAKFTGGVWAANLIVSAILDQVDVGIQAIDKLRTDDPDLFAKLAPSLDLMRDLAKRGRAASKNVHDWGVHYPKEEAGLNG